ncbi:MAG: hypothetical protein IJR14_03005 [Synergistaceae bacterium]|nr:hypothetical protein [Synergistaceae bacterium]
MSEAIRAGERWDPAMVRMGDASFAADGAAQMLAKDIIPRYRAKGGDRLLRMAERDLRALRPLTCADARASRDGAIHAFYCAHLHIALMGETEEARQLCLVLRAIYEEWEREVAS